MSMNVAKGRKFYDTGPWDCSQHYVIVFGATAFSTTAFRNSTLEIKTDTRHSNKNETFSTTTLMI